MPTSRQFAAVDASDLKAERDDQGGIDGGREQRLHTAHEILTPLLPCEPRAFDVGSRLGLPTLAPIEIAVYTRVRNAGMRETIRSLGAALRTTNASV